MNRHERKAFAALERRLRQLDPALDSTLRAGLPTRRRRAFAWSLVVLAAALLLLSLVVGYDAGVLLCLVLLVGAGLYLKRLRGRGRHPFLVIRPDRAWEQADE